MTATPELHASAQRGTTMKLPLREAKSRKEDEVCDLKPFCSDPEGSTPSPVKASQPAGSELCMDGGNTIREA